MKKNSKLLMVLSTTALLSLGAAFTSMAATGWAKENNIWRYYNKDGSYATNEWKKSGDQWFYLDENGKMVTNQLIEDGGNYYGVDANGAMITNSWSELVDEDDDNESHWYYFQGTGKAKESGFLTIDGKRYHFTDSKMDEGWLQVDDDTYLLNKYHNGTFGAVSTGWQYVEDFDNDDDTSADEEGWYYFGTNGKMVTDEEKKINGKYYVFDDKGLMLDHWVEFTKGSTATSSDAAPASIYKYYKTSDGDRQDGWVYLDDMNADDDGKETEEGWYYFKKGIPYTSEYKTTEIADGYGVARINGKIYCFNEDGKMVTGKVEASDGTYFYFDEDENNGSMKYGKVKIKDAEDLDDGTYYFNKNGSLGTKGASYTGVYKGYLYNNGEIVEAEDGMKYEKVTVDGKDYMVNESGKVVTSGTVKDDNDVKWSVSKDANGDYVIKQVS